MMRSVQGSEKLSLSSEKNLKPISVRYFLVELLTGIVFLICWLTFGHKSPGVALAYCVLLAGFIVATFIDLEHLIIPDEITLGGAGVGSDPGRHRADEQNPGEVVSAFSR